jgi:preprotein translocase subunit SecB
MAKKHSDRPSKSAGDGAPKPMPTAATGVSHKTEADAPNPGTAAQLNVLGQYIKDLSFENPRAPETLQAPGQNPQLQVSVNVKANPRPEGEYEVALNVEVHAKNDTGVIYNVELSYGGLFRLRNVPQNILQPVLFVDCPTLLFPFMRRVLADVTRDGGFPPLLLDPVDFGRLYAENLARAQAETAAKPNN